MEPRRQARMVGEGRKALRRQRISQNLTPDHASHIVELIERFKLAPDTLVSYEKGDDRKLLILANIYVPPKRDDPTNDQEH